MAFAVAIAAGGLVACGASSSDGERAALAVIEPTGERGAHGRVHFESVAAGGVHVVAKIDGLDAGAHGFHVHEVGDCSDGGDAAGPHFNFLGDAEPGRITGNLGELKAQSDGAAQLEATVAEARLDGPRSIVGRAVVVHARGNDPSEPPGGAAGSRIACGVIEAEDGRRDPARS